MGGALAVIPARLGSTRLPRKVLLRETGKYLVQHVWERVRRARSVGRVVIATDDEQVRAACLGFGAECMMTSPRHGSGTDRVAEVARRLRAKRIVNVQGDEPEADPGAIDRVIDALDEAELSTLATPLLEDAANPNRVKVVLDRAGFALYFSRSLIPHPREPLLQPLLHLGVYGYRSSALARWVSLPPSALERTEKLEQLRALEAGMRIRVVVRPTRWSGGIDTEADYRAFVRRYSLRRRRASAGMRPRRSVGTSHI
jgi:3-deoxy-manno-octulosonate cytidylyltransferase (CMP-KDO synthetase)